MAGRIIRVAPRQTYTWTMSTNGNTAVMWLGARAYPVLDAVSGVLQVAISSGTTITAAATVLIEVVNVLVTGDEPNVTFVQASNVGQVQLQAGVSGPVLQSGAVTLDNIGSMVAVRMTYTQGTGAASTLVAAVDLVLRDA
jgi:hypothetical protein